jgi:hypothetical protein
MASVALSRRVEKVVGHPPLSELSELQRREFHEALLEAGSFEDLPGKWQAAVLAAEQNRPKLRLITGRVARGGAAGPGRATLPRIAGSDARLVPFRPRVDR